MLLDPRTTERLEIGDRVYLLKVPTVAERVKWRRATAAAGGKQHSQLAMLDLISETVAELMAEDVPEVRQAVLDKIAAHRENLRTWATALVEGKFDGADADEALRGELDAGLEKINAGAKGLAEIELAVSEYSARYRSMISDNRFYSSIAGIEGARLFLRGWEGIEGKPVSDAGGLKETSMAKIPEADFAEIGAKIETLTRVSDAKRKNSGSSRPSSSGDQTSTT